MELRSSRERTTPESGSGPVASVSGTEKQPGADDAGTGERPEGK
ncbi:hypothetical protein [Paenibacillus albicereus]|nr:hypothetical protein [Paenibacillus albicereus]